MNIAVDVEPYFRNRAGVGRYVGGLLGAMTRLNAEDRFTLFRTRTHAGDGRVEGIDESRTQSRTLPGAHRWFMLRWLLLDGPPVERFIGEHDVYFGPLVPAFATRGRLVVMIHDLVWRRFPHLFPRHSIWTRRLGYRRALRRCAGIVTNSEASRRDILEAYDFDETRVRAIHLGVSQRLRSPAGLDEVSRVLSEKRLTQPYVLAVAGDNSPKKNLVTLVQAMAKLPASLSRVELVNVGKPRYDVQALRHEMAALGLTERVRFLGRVSDDELRCLYAGARLTAYPSLYEGFGFPVVESMGQGTPVVTSSVSSMPEVAGDAALLVDPSDVEGLSDAMRRLLEDDALHATLKRRGLERAASFTWERTARQTRAFLDEVVRG